MRDAPTSLDEPDPWSPFAGHERVVVAQDPDTGTAMVIALHSTVLGPALGGTRMTTYPHARDPGAAAYADALRLSRAMTYKNSLAGLDHGGGKGVIVADPHSRPDEVLRAYGRLVSSLHGAYVTAGDVGVRVTDMDIIAETCAWTTGRSPENGGVGDSGILTALGVFEGMRASVEVALGRTDLDGLRVAIVGTGKVGGRLAGHLIDAGAQVLAFDPHPQAREATADAHPQVRFTATLDELLASEVDVLSPNALGGLITTDLAGSTSARIICGGANNQLADPSVADLLAARGITYAPDFMVNCGGVIQVAEELQGGDLDRARARTEQVHATTLRVLERARAERVTPVTAAESEAEDRIRQSRAAQGRVV